MTDWLGITRKMESLLRLRTSPIAYKRLEKLEEMESIPRVRHFHRVFTFCELPTLVRRHGWTVGILRSNLTDRCARIHGLAISTEEQIAKEASRFGIQWFATVEVARKQMASMPLIPPGEALILAPLAESKFDPDVVLVYANPAQLSFLMNGLQFRDYERFNFYFLGEGSCADGLPQCYNSGKPSLVIPCYAERKYGNVTENELVMALPPAMVARAVDGMNSIIRESSFKYPIAFHRRVIDRLLFTYRHR
jgi:uncharacterized protein (DUF169 family)